MNSQRTVALTAAIFTVLGAVVAVVRRNQRLDSALVSAVYVALGATVPMVVALFRLPTGPGNLAPITIVVGILIFLVGAGIGAGAGWGIWNRLGRR